jgi:hypothetical protein
LGLEQVNLFIKRNKNIFFPDAQRFSKMRPYTNPLILIIGIFLLPVACSLLNKIL